MDTTNALNTNAVPLPKRGTFLDPARVANVVAFEAWLVRARAGDTCCYFEGALGAAREAPSLRLDADVATRLQSAAEALGGFAYRAYTSGFVHLLQRRHPLYNLGFRYLAVRSSKRGV